LARKLQNDFRASLSHSIKKAINDKGFIDRNRTDPKAFSRKRKMPFASLLIFLAGLRNRSMQSELNTFLDAKDSNSIQSIDASTLFKARLKLAPSVFVEINHHCIDFFREHGNFKRWNGFELVAVDGTTLRMPDTGDLHEFFRPNVDALGAPVGPLLGRMNMLYDPLNQLCLSAELDCTSVSEINQFTAHDIRWKAEQLFIADRHYDAFWLFVWFMEKGCDFCIRLKSKQRSQVREFLESGSREQIVELNPGRGGKRRCKQKGLSCNPIKLRLIRVDLPDGKVEILATSILDTKKVPVEQFAELYHLRWPVEEKFKQLKFRANIENWSGKSAMTVFQDVYARLWSCNLTVLMGIPLEAEIGKRKANCKYKYQLNWANALSCMGRAMVPLFIIGHCIQKTLLRLSRRMLSDLSSIRPNRKYPRNHKAYKRQFYMCYKFSF
jgi:hypothetical protein